MQNSSVQSWTHWCMCIYIIIWNKVFFKGWCVSGNYEDPHKSTMYTAQKSYGILHSGISISSIWIVVDAPLLTITIYMAWQYCPLPMSTLQTQTKSLNCVTWKWALSLQLSLYIQLCYICIRLQYHIPRSHYISWRALYKWVFVLSHFRRSKQYISLCEYTV